MTSLFSFFEFIDRHIDWAPASNWRYQSAREQAVLCICLAHHRRRTWWSYQPWLMDQRQRYSGNLVNDHCFLAFSWLRPLVQTLLWLRHRSANGFSLGTTQHSAIAFGLLQVGHSQLQLGLFELRLLVFRVLLPPVAFNRILFCNGDAHIFSFRLVCGCWHHLAREQLRARTTSASFSLFHDIASAATRSVHDDLHL